MAATTQVRLLVRTIALNRDRRPQGGNRRNRRSEWAEAAKLCGFCGRSACERPVFAASRRRRFEAEPRKPRSRRRFQVGRESTIPLHRRRSRSVANDPGRTRTCNPRFRGPMPYPLGHGASCLKVRLNSQVNGSTHIHGATQPSAQLGQPSRAVIAQLAARRSHNPKVVSLILTHRIACSPDARRLAGRRGRTAWPAPPWDSEGGPAGQKPAKDSDGMQRITADLHRTCF